MNTLLSIKKLRENQKRIPFFSSVDLLTVEEDGLVIGVSGRAGYGYRLLGVDYQLRDSQGINSFLHDTEKILKQIPDGIVLSFHKRSRSGDPELIRKYSALVSKDDPVSRRILEAKVKALRTQRLLKKELFLFISFLPINSAPNFLTKSSSAAFSYESSRKTLRETESLLLTGFQALGVKINRLSKNEVLSEYYTRLNPLLSELVPHDWAFPEDPISHPRFETLRSRLLLHPPKITDEAFYLDGYYHSVCNLRTLPEEAGVGMVKRFEKNLPEDSEWVLTARKKEKTLASQKMRVKANMSKAGMIFRLSEDHFASERSRQHESFLKDMAENGGEVFEISLSVLVKARSLKELEGKKDAVLKNFPKLGGAMGVSDHFEHDRLFISHLPIQGDDNLLRFPVLSRALAALIPLGDEWKGCAHPELLLKTYQDEGLALDLFDPSLPAKHAIMIGSTGSGKSFTTNYLLSHFMSAGDRNHVIVIDVGGSYRKLARIFQGSYFEVQCSEEFAMNPFPEKEKIFSKNQDYDPDQLSFLATLLEKMVTEHEKLTSSDQRILESAVIETYRTRHEGEAPLLQDVREVLKNYPLGDEEDKKRAYQFSKQLGVWTEGRFGKILNRPGKMRFSDRLIVFDLARLSVYPELQSILFFVIHSALSRKIRDLSLRKMFVIDEGWRFFNDEVGSRLVEELYRTARKNNALILSISQSPEDFLSSKASTAILANSYVKYVLKLQKGHDKLRHFDLNENETAACRELEMIPGKYSEVFIRFFEKSVIAKIEPSPVDYWIATTDPDDFLAEQEIVSEFPNLSSAEILEKLALRHPCGVKRSSMDNEGNRG